MAQPTIAILSIGDMGLGIAKLLIAHGYRVITNVSDRSEATHHRALSASLTLYPTDLALSNAASIILSIVPPRDALSTAQRIASASQDPGFLHTPTNPLYYIDLNAISPSTARNIHSLFTTSSPAILSLDGGIIGGPPRLNPSTNAWTKPRLPISGPYPLPSSPEEEETTPSLSTILNITHISPLIGPASALKMSFASLTKGLTALALQSFTTAYTLGILPELQEHLDAVAPGVSAVVKRSVVGCVGKAYRWVGEMEEIGATFGDEGGWSGEEDVFGGVAGVYRAVAEDAERAGGRRPETVEEVVRMVAEGNEGRRRKRARSV